MNKAHVTHLLSEYLEGGLPHAGIEKVKAHLAFCNACRQALAETERHIELLKATPGVRLPAGLETRVLAKVHEELSHAPAAEPAEGKFSWPVWLTPLRGMAVAATCAIALIVVHNMPRNGAPDHTDSLEKEDQKTSQMPFRGQRAEQRRAGGASNEVDSMKAMNKPEAFGGLSKDLARASVGKSEIAAPAAAPAEPLRLNAKKIAEPAPPAADLKAEVKEAPANQPALEQRSADEIGPQALSSGRAVEDKISSQKAAAAGAASVRADQGATAPPLALRDAEKAAAPSVAAPSPMEGARSAIEVPLETVISSQADWAALWKRHTANIQPPPALPAVDFQTQQVLAIFAGEHPTGGFRVDMMETSKTIWNGDTVRVVRYRIVGPPPGVMAAQVISYPYLLQIQPRFDGKTFFEKRP